MPRGIRQAREYKNVLKHISNINFKCSFRKEEHLQANVYVCYETSNIVLTLSLPENIISNENSWSWRDSLVLKSVMLSEHTWV